MRWQGQEGSKNVEDRRGMSGGAAAVGGGSILIVIITIIMTLMGGGDVQQVVQNVQQQQAQAAAANPAKAAERSPEEEMQAEFSRVVLKYTEDVWSEQFPKLLGKPYRKPVLVLFTGKVNSACGSASAAVGPFYCPGDSKVYLDLSFFDELKTKFKAPGDFACAYVIAHEVGHHIQNLLGLSMKVQSMQAKSSKVEANKLSVRLELQADFLAGVWAHHAQKKWSILESGDIEEAIRAAQAIGDDTLQRQATGRVVPDSFTHGSADQRIRWFTYGLKTGNFEALEEPFQVAYEEL